MTTSDMLNHAVMVACFGDSSNIHAVRMLLRYGLLTRGQGTEYEITDKCLALAHLEDGDLYSYMQFKQS